MCNPISFCMMPCRAGQPRQFFLHKTKPLAIHSHTAIKQSHGFAGSAHDSIINFEYRPFTKTNGEFNDWSSDFKKNDGFDLIVDHGNPRKSDFDAALTFAQSLIPRYIKVAAREKLKEKKRQAREAAAHRIFLAKQRKAALALARQKKATLERNRLSRSNGIYAIDDPDANANGWTRRFSRHISGDGYILRDQVWSQGRKWQVTINFDQLTREATRAVQIFLLQTTTHDIHDLYAICHIYQNEVKATNLDLWFKQLVRLIGYKKPIPGGTGF